MHEISVALSMVRELEAVAAEHGVASIRSVRVRVGALAGVVESALYSAFDVVREDTVCADAELVIESIPARIECALCGPQPLTDLTLWFCPICDRPSSRLLSGQELELVSIEVDDVADLSAITEPGATESR